MRAVAGYRADGEDHVVTAHTCTEDSSDLYGSLYGPVSQRNYLNQSFLNDAANIPKSNFDYAMNCGTYVTCDTVTFTS